MKSWKINIWLYLMAGSLSASIASCKNNNSTSERGTVTEQAPPADRGSCTEVPAIEIQTKRLANMKKYLASSGLQKRQDSNPDLIVYEKERRNCDVSGVKYFKLELSYAMQDIWERTNYHSGRHFTIIDSDAPGSPPDTTCEFISIFYSFCDRTAQYELHTSEFQDGIYDGLPTTKLNRFEADSILHRWGITRYSPPEDFEWEK